jgi:hypothetical protein
MNNEALTITKNEDTISVKIENNLQVEKNTCNNISDLCRERIDDIIYNSTTIDDNVFSSIEYKLNLSVDIYQAESNEDTSSLGYNIDYMCLDGNVCTNILNILDNIAEDIRTDYFSDNNEIDIDISLYIEYLGHIEDPGDEDNE